MAIRHAGLESAYTQVQNLYDYLYQCVFLIGMDLGTKNKGFSIAATISMQNSFEAVNNFRQAIGSYSDIDERVPSLSSIWLDVRQDEIFLNAAMDAVPYLNSFQRLDLHRRYGEALSRASAVRRGMVEYACEDMAEKAPKAMTFIFGKLHKTESAPRVNI